MVDFKHWYEIIKIPWFHLFYHWLFPSRLTLNDLPVVCVCFSIIISPSLIVGDIIKKKKSIFLKLYPPSVRLHALKNLTFQFTPVTHMVYLEIRLRYLDFAIEKLTSSNWISKYTMCVTGVNWKVKFLSACISDL